MVTEQDDFAVLAFFNEDENRIPSIKKKKNMTKLVPLMSVLVQNIYQ